MSDEAFGGAISKPTRSAFSRRHPTLYLWLHGTIGLLLAIACTWIFAAIADEVPEKGTMVRVDLAVTTWLQAHGTEGGETVFSVVSLLGAQLLIVILVAVAILFIIRRDWRHLIVLLVTAGGGSLLNVALKGFFHRERPSFASEFHATSWSFPSGHAMDSLIGYGLLAHWLSARFPGSRSLIASVAVALVLLVGFSRIYLGVHYLSDVIAGYSAGLIWLTVCITGYQFAERRRVGPAGEDER